MGRPGGRTALVGLGTAAALAISGGGQTASAEPVTLRVTLLGGAQLTLQADLPPGTPVDDLRLPGVALPVLKIEVVHGTAPAPAPAPAEAPAGSPPPTGRPGEPAAGSRPEVKATAKQQRTRPARRRPRASRTEVRRAAARQRSRRKRADGRADITRDGAPTPANPTFSFAVTTPAATGLPSFFIDKFRIPPFLLPIYQAAGSEYGIRWEVLAAINEIETDYGRNLSVSGAGALGWMQFMPSTWKAYGVDANRDGKKDPYNPVDAIFAAANYLKASGGDKDIRRAVFAYNHADWYVDSVLMRARLVAGIPADLVGSLTGLTQGRFPVAASTRYARTGPTAALFAPAGAPVLAVQDGRVIRTGRSQRLGRYLQMQDVYGNTYTYGSLAARERPVVTTTQPMTIELRSTVKQRLFAHPKRPRVAAQLVSSTPPKRLRAGSLVKGGQVIGTVAGGTRATASHLAFEIRPAGKGTPRIDPKPLLDGWELLESTAIYRTRGSNPLLDGAGPSAGQLLLMSKAALTRRVLANPRIEIYRCGRREIASGAIDRRVLATLEFLAASGMRPTVSALRCGHPLLTAGGRVSQHSTGSAVDISRINGVPILGHQGPGSITDLAVRRVLTLQGAMKPSQVISLMSYSGQDNTLALKDHDDHLHIGWAPRYGAKTASRYDAVLKPSQWIKLIDRIGKIDNPQVSAGD